MKQITHIFLESENPTLKVAIKKNWRSQNFDFPSLKNLEKKIIEFSNFLL